MMKSEYIIIISGPSGVGKGRVINELRDQLTNVSVAVSATTRLPREGEVHGTDYFFMTDDEFKKNAHEDAFLEFQEVHAASYGTLKSEVKRITDNHHFVLLEIDTKGAIEIKERYPKSTLIFLAPPNMEVLKQRLVKRNQNSEQDMQNRVSHAENELKLITYYDNVVVNDTLNDTVNQVKDIINSITSVDQNIEGVQ